MTSSRTPRLGYALMTEQSGPRELVRYAGAAEEAGFDFAITLRLWRRKQQRSGC
jgi:hypothetical protein